MSEIYSSTINTLMSNLQNIWIIIVDINTFDNNQWSHGLPMRANIAFEMKSVRKELSFIEAKLDLHYLLLDVQKLHKICEQTVNRKDCCPE